MKKLFFLGLLTLAIVLFPAVGYCRVNMTIAGDEGGGGGGPDYSMYLVKAFQHIYESIDKYGTASLRLIEGESYPYTRGQQYTAWVYDNSLAIISLVTMGRPEDLARARLLCKTLIWAQKHDPLGFIDGRLHDSYWANNMVNPDGAAIKAPNTSTGNMAWVIIAWLRYYNYGREAVTLSSVRKF